jgi:hypothetical protein
VVAGALGLKRGRLADEGAGPRAVEGPRESLLVGREKLRVDAARFLMHALAAPPRFDLQRRRASDAIKERAKSARPLSVGAFEDAALAEEIEKDILYAVVDELAQLAPAPARGKISPHDRKVPPAEFAAGHGIARSRA